MKNLLLIAVLLFSTHIITVYPFIALFYLFDNLGYTYIVNIIGQYFNLIDAIAVTKIFDLSLIFIFDIITRIFIIFYFYLKVENKYFKNITNWEIKYCENK